VQILCLFVSVYFCLILPSQTSCCVLIVIMLLENDIHVQCYSCVIVCSWTVLRSQCVAEESSLKHGETGVSRSTDNCRTSSANEWCLDADDWGDDVDDDSNCCIGEIHACNSHELVDSSMCSTQIISAATNVANVDSSSSVVLPLPCDKPVASVRPSDASADKPAELLQHLTIESELPVSTPDTACSHTQQHTVSDVPGELLSRSFKSTSSAAAELESYYIYVMDEFSTDYHSKHIDDLLMRYALQEGGNFKDELESGNSLYVIYNRLFNVCLEKAAAVPIEIQDETETVAV